MSVQALSWVFDHDRHTGSERLVLLSIANHADNVGRNAWPSIPTIGREAGLGETRTKQALRTLGEDGTLRIERNAGGMADTRSDRRPNRYTILPMQALDPVDNPAPTGVTRPTPDDSTGVTSGADGGHTGDREPSFTEQHRVSDSHVVGGPAVDTASRLAHEYAEIDAQPHLSTEQIRANRAKARLAAPPDG